MSPSITLEVLVVGEEVLAGATVDTNSGDVARAVQPVGLRVARTVAVGDRPDEIRDAARAALARAHLLVVTGGLGPTPDDCTKEALAELFADELELDPATLEEIRARFAARGLAMPESNRKQALLPRAARKIPNTIGSAPGVHWVRGEAEIFVLPGVPAEMRAMLEAYVVPRLAELTAGRAVPSAEFRTAGVAESALVEKLQEVLAQHAGLEWGFYAGLQGVDIRVRQGETGGDLAAAAAAVRAALGHSIYTEEPGVPLEEIVRRLLVERGHRLAVAESCTGGLLGGRITAVSGSSACFVGGFITYADATKEAWLGVSAELLQRHGAVSAPVAAAMARGVRARAGVELGVAVTGIAGPTGGTAEKPVGLTFLALAAADGCWTRRQLFGKHRQMNRDLASQRGLDLVRRYELGDVVGDPA
jgi:competence/damage-inducible protein CinA-like protein